MRGKLMSCTQARTQYNVPGQGLNLERLVKIGIYKRIGV